MIKSFKPYGFSPLFPSQFYKVTLINKAELIARSLRIQLNQLIITWVISNVFVGRDHWICVIGNFGVDSNILVGRFFEILEPKIWI